MGVFPKLNCFIYGARQVGKTTLSKKLLSKYGNEKDYFNCDIINVRESLEKQDPILLKRVFGNSINSLIMLHIFIKKSN